MKSRPLATLRKKTFENIVEKRENAGIKHFLFFPTMFTTLHKTNFNISVTFTLTYANALTLYLICQFYDFQIQQ